MKWDFKHRQEDWYSVLGGPCPLLCLWRKTRKSADVGFLDILLGHLEVLIWWFLSYVFLNLFFEQRNKVISWQKWSWETWGETILFENMLQSTRKRINIPGAIIEISLKLLLLGLILWNHNIGLVVRLLPWCSPWYIDKYTKLLRFLRMISQNVKTNVSLSLLLGFGKVHLALLTTFASYNWMHFNLLSNGCLLGKFWISTFDLQGLGQLIFH